MANIITVCRILCSILLLFYPVFSPAFYILYIVAGFTDMIDGIIARKTNTTNDNSRGIGNSIIPIRFNSRPENVIVEWFCEI